MHRNSCGRVLLVNSLGMKSKLAEEFSKAGIKDRLSSKTIHPTWKKVRNVAGVTFVIGSLITAAPIAIPASIASWIGYITLVSGVVSGRAQLNKKKV